MELKIKKVRDNAVIPTYGSEAAAACGHGGRQSHWWWGTEREICKWGTVRRMAGQQPDPA